MNSRGFMTFGRYIINLDLITFIDQGNAGGSIVHFAGGNEEIPLDATETKTLLTTLAPRPSA